MTFPVMIPLGPLKVHPHLVFELLAYLVGYRLFLRGRRRGGDAVSWDTRTMLILGAAAGALVGSKLVAWAEHYDELLRSGWNLAILMDGKSVVGGLLGGKIGCEIVKWRMGETRRTGDLFAIPFCVALAIGRVGCFLTGLDDHTAGNPTSLPWGINFGDGVMRHPTQLYEIAALASIVAVCVAVQRRAHRPGDVFGLMTILYLGWRLAIDSIKPELRPFAGLCVIQLVCVAGLFWFGFDFLRGRRAAGVMSHG